MLNFEDYKLQKHVKFLGLSEQEKRARYDQYRAAHHGADLPGPSRSTVGARATVRRSQPGTSGRARKPSTEKRAHGYLKEDEALIARTMINPWAGEAFRIPDGNLNPKTVLYSQAGKGTIQSPATSTEVLFLTASDVGDVSSDTSAVRFTTAANTATSVNVVRSGGSAFLKDRTIPEPAKILQNRPNAAALKVLYDGDISTATGEATLGTVPLRQGFDTFSYNELAESDNVRTVSVQELVRNEIYLPFSKLSSQANHFIEKGSNIGMNINIPIIAFTGLPPGVTIRLAYLEYGECQLEVNDPGNAGAARHTGSHFGKAYGAVNEALSDGRPFFTKSYSESDNPNWVLNAISDKARSMYDAAGGIGGIVSGITALSTLL